MKMKKFINSPETVTDELIAGLGLAGDGGNETVGHRLGIEIVQPDPVEGQLAQLLEQSF